MTKEELIVWIESAFFIGPGSKEHHDKVEMIVKALEVYNNQQNKDRNDGIAILPIMPSFVKKSG